MIASRRLAHPPTSTIPFHRLGLPGDPKIVRQAIARFLSGRAFKTQRFALSIGADANPAMLKDFAGSEGKVFRAQDASHVASFMRYVTLSVTTRTKSTTPNIQPHVPDPFDLKAL